MEKDFQANYGLIVSKAYKEKAADNSEDFFIESIVSGTLEDRDGERMSKGAVADMINQFKNSRIPFFADHGKNKEGIQTYAWKDIMGVWVDAHQSGDHIVAKVRLNKANPDAMVLYNYAQADMPLGFSIGGRVEKDFEEEYGDDEE